MNEKKEKYSPKPFDLKEFMEVLVKTMKLDGITVEVEFFVPDKNNKNIFIVPNDEK